MSALNNDNMLFYIPVIQFNVWPKIVFYMIVVDSYSHLLCKTTSSHLTQIGTIFVLIYYFGLK